MPISIIINGAHGKMGKIAYEALVNHPTFQLVGTIGRHDNLQQTILDTGAQVVLDLTRADCVFENARTILKQGACPVIGTSGLTSEQIKVINDFCTKNGRGALIVPNFSIGALLMMHCAKLIASFLPEVEIIESHHQQKLDAPSGTALKTADLINEARKTAPQPLALKELVQGARGARYHDIPIHSIRLPGLLARQQVIFGNPGETLTIEHNSIDRSCFKPGIILACQQVVTLTSLQYGLDGLLDDKSVLD